MTLFLTSSPCIFGAPKAILNPANGFFEKLHAAIPEMARCLFVCSDPDDYRFTDRVSTEMQMAFREAGFPFLAWKTLDRRNRENARDLVEESDFIVLAGGHVPTQNCFFGEIGLGDLLRGYPGTVMGISAGSMNCAAMVYAQPEERGEAIDPAYRRFLPGLGLTFVNILPHFNQWREWWLDGMRLLEDVTVPDSFGHRFFVLTDGSFLRACGGKTELFGEAYLLEEGILRKICEDGDSIVL